MAGKSPATNLFRSSLINSIITAFIVCTMVFLVLRVIPGDPVDLMIGEYANEIQHEKLRHDLSLDLPLSTQFVTYIKGLITMDLGQSINKKLPVFNLILDRIPYTLLLSVSAAIFANITGILLGLISAAKPQSMISKLIHFYCIFFLSLPTFWLGPVLILLLSLQFPWLPFSSYTSLSSVILPALTLGFGMSSIIAKTTENSLKNALNTEYLRTARAKGASELRILVVHALPNALIPTLMISTLQFGNLLSGSIVTESIFNWPGIGGLAFEAISSRDYPTVQGIALVIAFSYIIINLTTELIRNRLVGEKSA